MLEVIIVVAAVASIATALGGGGHRLWLRIQAFRRARAEKAAKRVEEAAKVDLLVRKVSELVERLNGAGE